MNTKVIKSTGIASLDFKILKSIKHAQFKTQNISYISQTDLPIELHVNTVNTDPGKLPLLQESDQCHYHFNSINWQKQIQNQYTSFDYTGQPQLSISKSELQGKNRRIRFSVSPAPVSHLSPASIYASAVNISESSGLHSLDTKLINAVIFHPVVSRRFWIQTPGKFHDEISFQLDECMESAHPPKPDL